MFRHSAWALKHILKHMGGVYTLLHMLRRKNLCMKIKVIKMNHGLHVIAVLSHVQLLQPCGLQPARLLSSWDSPGKNTGVSWHALLHGIFPTQQSNPGLLHCRRILYCLNCEKNLCGKEPCLKSLNHYDLACGLAQSKYLLNVHWMNE